MLKAVIMAGGHGKRFWPLSRRDHPKQFLKIGSPLSMIQLTEARLLSRLNPAEDVFVVTTAEMTDLVRRHLPALPAEHVIAEPFGLNTAPCVALTALYLSRRCPLDTVTLMAPADHLIADVDAFIACLDKAVPIAAEGELVALGVRPTCPATGYGYIEVAEKSDAPSPIVRFKEKPDRKTAETFLKSGRYYWNAGIYLWTLEAILSAYRRHAPGLMEILEQVLPLWDARGADADIAEVYGRLSPLPFELAVMEKAERRAVVPGDFGWNDVGGWRACYEVSPKDADGNAVTGPVKALNSHNNLVHADKFTALIGVDDLVIVDTPNALLIARRDCSEQVKDIVDALEKNGDSDCL